MLQLQGPMQTFTQPKLGGEISLQVKEFSLTAWVCRTLRAALPTHTHMFGT